MYIVVVGAGMVGGELARRLVADKHDVVIIDQNKEVCDRLYAEIGVVAVNGDAEKIEVLHEADIEKAEVVVVAMDNDAENLACAILAKSFGVPQIIARMRDPAYEDAYRLAGVTSIVHVIDLMINEMIMDIEHPKVRRITTIGGGRADIFMVIIPPGAKVAGKRVEDIAKNPKFPSQCIFIATYNREKEEFAIPRGGQVINEGDEVFLISNAENIKEAADFLTA
ncbi:MAG: potassium channel family protein [Candidatus Poribacteria bacterium]